MDERLARLLKRRSCRLFNSLFTNKKREMKRKKNARKTTISINNLSVVFGYCCIRHGRRIRCIKPIVMCSVTSKLCPNTMKQEMMRRTSRKNVESKEFTDKLDDSSTLFITYLIRVIVMVLIIWFNVYHDVWYEMRQRPMWFDSFSFNRECLCVWESEWVIIWMEGSIWIALLPPCVPYLKSYLLLTINNTNSGLDREI